METKKQLSEAIALIKSGQKVQAQPILTQIVRQEPRNEIAWLWLSACLDEIDKKKFCIKKVLEINPANQQAQQALAKLETEPGRQPFLAQPTSPQAAQSPSNSYKPVSQAMQPPAVERQPPPDTPVKPSQTSLESKDLVLSGEIGKRPVQPGKELAWYDVWLKVLTSPTEQTFQEILRDPTARPLRALLWVFTTTLIVILIFGILFGLFLDTGLQQIASSGISTQYSYEDMRSVAGYILIGIFTASPFIALLSVLGVVIYTAIYQFTARLLIGEGTYPELLYAMSAISAPFTLISGLFTAIGLIPGIGIVLSCINMAVGLYGLYLNLSAIKAVHRIGWGQAFGVFLSVPLLLFACTCLAGLAFSSTLSNLDPGLLSIPTPP